MYKTYALHVALQSSPLDVRFLHVAGDEILQVFCSPDVSQRFLGSDGLLASDRPSVPGCEFRVGHLDAW